MGRTELYDKTDDFNFPIVNFPFICTELTVSIGEMKSSLRKFCGHHHELTFMEYPCYKLSWICSTCCKQFSILSSCLNYHRVCKQINTTDVTCREITAHPSEASQLIFSCWWDSWYSIFSFMCMFCASLFVILPLCFS